MKNVIGLLEVNKSALSKKLKFSKQMARKWGRKNTMRDEFKQSVIDITNLLKEIDNAIIIISLSSVANLKWLKEQEIKNRHCAKMPDLRRDHPDLEKIIDDCFDAGRRSVLDKFPNDDQCETEGCGMATKVKFKSWHDYFNGFMYSCKWIKSKLEESK